MGPSSSSTDKQQNIFVNGQQQKAPVTHSGEGFDPFSTPSVPVLNESSPVATTSGVKAPESEVDVGSFSGAKDKTNVSGQLSQLEQKRNTIREAAGTTGAATSALSADKDSLGSVEKQSNARINDLSTADRMLTSRISNQNASIQECEKALQKAIQNCDMEGKQEHRAMLARKRQVLLELENMQAEAKSKLAEEQGNNSDILATSGKVKTELTKSIGQGDELATKSGTADELYQTVSGTNVSDNKVQAAV